jgi:uncharacterized protein YjiK
MMKVMVWVLVILVVFIMVLIISCNPKQKKGESQVEESPKKFEYTYNLDDPSNTYILPGKLNEISGLSYYKGNEVMCVNDEKGKIFTYDLGKEEITNTLDFGKDGDYEGIEIVRNIAYVLRSDGKIKAVNLDTNDLENIDCTLPKVVEYEGLAYDSKSNSLLLAVKQMKDEKAAKQIYSYDLNSKSFNLKLEIAQNEIQKNGKGMEFRPSGIAVHPLNGQIYVIASAGKKMLIFSETGNVISQFSLDSKIYEQPEGICFTPSGEMLIASEGGKGSGYILKFKPQ